MPSALLQERSALCNVKRRVEHGFRPELKAASRDVQDAPEVCQLLARIAPDIKLDVVICLLCYLDVWDDSKHALLTLDDLRRAPECGHLVRSKSGMTPIPARDADLPS